VLKKLGSADPILDDGVVFINEGRILLGKEKWTIDLEVDMEFYRAASSRTAQLVQHLKEQIYHFINNSKFPNINADIDRLKEEHRIIEVEGEELMM
jgi:hypothetical protein